MDREAEPERNVSLPEGLTAGQLERIWAESVPQRPAPETVPAAEHTEPAKADFVAPDQGPTVSSASADHWTRLALAALAEPDPERRGEAIHELGLQRSAEAVTILMEAALDDPDPDNRFQALEQLWYAAADGLDGDRSILRTLEAALADPDEDIAALAHRALLDLARLAQND